MRFDREHIYHFHRIPYNRTLAPGTVDGPPYSYSDVTLQFFPLKANPVQLSQFIDSYLNILPETIAYYRPAIPFVFLIVASYGQMGQDGALQYGSVSETEVGFAVPLIQYRREGEKIKVVDFGFVFPYIYCSSVGAMLGGRLIFGWPKVLGWFGNANPRALSNPLAWKTKVSLGTILIPRLWQGDRPRPGTLLEVQSQPESRPLLSPFGFSPFRWLDNATRGVATAWSDAMQILTWWGRLSMPLAERFDEASETRSYDANPHLLDGEYSHGYGIPGFDADIGRRPSHRRSAPRSPLTKLKHLVSSAGSDVARLMSRVLADLAIATTGTGLDINLYTLKQFRDAENEQYACYQGLITSKMTVERISEFGLLGERALLNGDPSGGFRVAINLYASQAMVEVLGLETSYVQWGRSKYAPSGVRQTTGPSGNTELHHLPTPRETHLIEQLASPSVAVLEPILPFWVKLDALYSAEHSKAWRLFDSQRKDSPWMYTGGESLDTYSTAPSTGPPLYNTSLGGAVDEVTGPFKIADSTVRVLPLSCSRQRLRQFCDQYINISPYDRFEPCGPFVFLLCVNYGQMASLTENVASWARREVMIAVPATHTRCQTSRRKSAGETHRDSAAHGKMKHVLVVPYVFSDSLIGTLTSNEVQGFNTLLSDIQSPPDTWMSSEGPRTEQPLLRLWTSLFPSADLASNPGLQVLIEVLQATAGHRRRRDGGNQPARRGRTHRAHVRKAVRGFVRAIEAEDSVVPMLTLKQFRGVGVVDEVCYQAIVSATHRLQVEEPIQWTRSPLEVRIQQNPMLCLREDLGLEPDRQEVAKPIAPNRVWQGFEVDIFQSVAPFWFNASLESSGSRNLAWRAEGSPEWKQPNAIDPTPRGR